MCFPAKMSGIVVGLRAIKICLREGEEGRAGGGDYGIRKCTAASYAMSVWKQVGLRNCVFGLDTCGRRRIEVCRRSHSYWH